MSQVKSGDDKLEKQIGLLSEKTNDIIYNQRKYLLGRVLTIVDAVTSDSEQRKAIKDVVQDLFYQGSYWNDISYQFNQFRKANGLKVVGDALPQPAVDELNIYKEV